MKSDLFNETLQRMLLILRIRERTISGFRRSVLDERAVRVIH